MSENKENQTPVTILSIRRSLGLTQLEFSHVTGIPRRTIQDWENDLRHPPEWLIPILAFAIDNGYIASCASDKN